MHAWLEDFPYRINIGWSLFVAASCIALVIALLTVSFQVIKAAIANPAKSLRTE
jgi:putative ABC transport system permease protein